MEPDKLPDAAVGAGAGGATSDQATRIYLSQRIQALRSEIAELRKEEKSVRSELRRTTDKRSPAARKLKLRRIYLTRRPEEAKGEMETLSKQLDAIRVRKRPA